MYLNSSPFHPQDSVVSWQEEASSSGVNTSSGSPSLHWNLVYSGRSTKWGKPWLKLPLSYFSSSVALKCNCWESPFSKCKMRTIERNDIKLQSYRQSGRLEAQSITDSFREPIKSMGATRAIRSRTTHRCGAVMPLQESITKEAGRAIHLGDSGGRIPAGSGLLRVNPLLFSREGVQRDDLANEMWKGTITSWVWAQGLLFLGGQIQLKEGKSQESKLVEGQRFGIK